MKINKMFVKGEVFISREFFSFEGEKIDFQGSSPLSSFFRLGQEVYFSFRQKTMRGEISKINKTTATITTPLRDYKVAIENIVADNRYPTTIYRLVHRKTGKGVFSVLLDECAETHRLAQARSKMIKEERYHQLQTPSQDKLIAHHFTQEFKCACLSKSDLVYWFGKEIIEREDLFEIKELVYGRDYLESYVGSEQVIYKEV